jgi:hypothetical protein
MMREERDVGWSMGVSSSLYHCRPLFRFNGQTKKATPTYAHIEDEKAMFYSSAAFLRRLLPVWA